MCYYRHYISTCGAKNVHSLRKYLVLSIAGARRLLGLDVVVLSSHCCNCKLHGALARPLRLQTPGCKSFKFVCVPQFSGHNTAVPAFVDGKSVLYKGHPLPRWRQSHFFDWRGPNFFRCGNYALAFPSRHARTSFVVPCHFTAFLDLGPQHWK